jgi:hypothetical protein
MTRSARSLLAGVVVSSLIAAGPRQAMASQSHGAENLPVQSVHLERATLEGVELEYTVRGTGEPASCLSTPGCLPIGSCLCSRSRDWRPATN